MYETNLVSIVHAMWISMWEDTTKSVEMSGLSDAEHRAMELTAELWNLIVREVIAPGPAQDQDRQEMATKIHAIQHTIMGQAAARAHPDKYRLLGEALKPEV